MLSQIIEFKYSWDSGIIVLAVSFIIVAGFLIISTFLIPGIIALIIFIICFILACSRGIAIFIAVFRSPSELFIEDDVLVARMINGKVIKTPLQKIDEIRKNALLAFCSQYSISIISTELNVHIIVRDEQVNNGKMIEFSKKANTNCQIDPRIAIKSEYDSSREVKAVSPKFSYKISLFISAVFLIGSAYSFLTQSIGVSTKVETLSKLTHQLYGYLALIPALFFIGLALILFRLNKNREHQK